MHDWCEGASWRDDQGNALKVEWCALCGALRKQRAFMGIVAAPEVYFPWAYMKVSETTCAKARKLREEENNAPGGSKLRRSGATVVRGEVVVRSRVVPIPGPVDSGDGGDAGGPGTDR